MQILRAKESDMDRLKDFYVQKFPDKPALHDMSVWKWTFLDNPNTRECTSFYILEDNNEIQGGIGYIPVTLLVSDKEVDSCHPVNFFVTNKFKGLAALRLFRRVLDESPVVFSSYLSGDAVRLLKASGFNDLSPVLKNYYLPLRTENSRGNAGKTRKTFIIAFIRKAWLTSLLVIHKFLYKFFPIFHSNVLNKANCPDVIPNKIGLTVIKKDFDYLNWRYAKSPKLDCSYFYSKKGNSPTAALGILHLDHNNNEAIIMDMVYSCFNFLDIMLLCISMIQFCKQTDIDMITTTCTDSRIGRVLSLIGFGKTESSYRFMVYTEDKELNPIISDASSWSFFIGNTDVY